MLKYNCVFKEREFLFIGKMTFYTGQHLQRGFGVGGFFKGLISLFRPLIRLFKGPAVTKTVDVLRKVAQKPIVKKAANSAKKELGRTAVKVMSDVLDGENVKQATKKHSLKALQNIATVTLKSPVKKQRKKKSLKTHKRKRSIFDT